MGAHPRLPNVTSIMDLARAAQAARDWHYLHMAFAALLYRFLEHDDFRLRIALFSSDPDGLEPATPRQDFIGIGLAQKSGYLRVPKRLLREEVVYRCMKAIYASGRIIESVDAPRAARKATPIQEEDRRNIEAQARALIGDAAPKYFIQDVLPERKLKEFA